MKVSEAMILAGIKFPNITIVTDRIFQTSCATCGTTQRLSESKISKSEDITYYRCKNGCDKEISLVYKLGSIQNESGHAYRLKDYVVKCYSDLYIVMPNGSVIQFPK